MTDRRVVRRPFSWRIVSRVERPEAVLLAIVLAGIAVAGWYGSTFLLAVAIGAQLLIGGLGAVWVIGPANARLGFARYATLAAAAVALTVFGQLTVGSIGLGMVPIAAVLLWVVLWLELAVIRDGRGGLPLELALIGIVFTGAAGIATLIGRDGWGAVIALTLAVCAVPAVRSAERRSRFGGEAIGQALLHLLGVAQVTAVVALLAIPPVVGAALTALTFHAWGGAAESLDEGASARAVALEFGALAVLGVVVALLLAGG